VRPKPLRMWSGALRLPAPSAILVQCRSGDQGDRRTALSQLRIQLHRDLPRGAAGGNFPSSCLRPLPQYALVLRLGLAARVDRR
jgi:hypothetical protein